MYNTAICAYGYAGALNEAFELQKNHGLNGTSTLNLLINACAQSGQADRAFEVYKEMQEAGQTANQVTFNSLINACARAKNELLSWVAFREMQSCGIVPDNYSLPALLKSQFSDSGIEQALEVVFRINPSRLNRFVFSAGFSALNRYAKERLCIWCGSLLFFLSPSPYAYFVCLPVVGSG